MTPDTVHLIAQEIRQWRGDLTAEETWLQKQPKSDTRDERFRYINWWRKAIRLVEHQLASE